MTSPIERSSVTAASFTCAAHHLLVLLPSGPCTIKDLVIAVGQVIPPTQGAHTQNVMVNSNVHVSSKPEWPPLFSRYCCRQQPQRGLELARTASVSCWHWDSSGQAPCRNLAGYFAFRCRSKKPAPSSFPGPQQDRRANYIGFLCCFEDHIRSSRTVQWSWGG